MTFEELSHYLRLGGVTLAIILAASVLAIGVAVERWIALWNIAANSRALTDAVGRHLLRGDVSGRVEQRGYKEKPLSEPNRDFRQTKIESLPIKGETRAEEGASV